MFIQVIQGKLADEAGMRVCMDRWTKDLMPGATGYLGTTAGMTDDGTFVALARFSSAEDARRNSERPEQGQWWAEMEKCFAGPVTFMDCPDTTTWLGGGSDEAGFVQVMEGRSTEMARLTRNMTTMADRIHQHRPEIIGGTISSTPDGRYVEAVYFTSEDEARAHEKMEVPDDLRQLFDEDAKVRGETTYLDLHHPMLMSASG